MPKIYLTKASYEKDHGPGSFGRVTNPGANKVTRSTNAGGNQRGLPYARPQAKGSAQSKNNVGNRVNNNNNPSQQQKQQQGGNAKGTNKMSKNRTALATAKVLVASGNHPRKEEIRQLLQAYDKGWVEDHKFTTELQKLIV